ncbi:hypothetical protein [Vibrio celticus]|uniref:hypothetical protein n=1 Tax=Vibrio celticus TaxID=446372 RepID=UPI003521FC1A
MIPYNGIITILHSNDPNVDGGRDQLKESIMSINTLWDAERLALAKPIALNNGHDYYSDGPVLLVS